MPDFQATLWTGCGFEEAINKPLAPHTPDATAPRGKSNPNHGPK